MTLILCSECGAEISTAAVACPRCGHPMSHAERPTPLSDTVSEPDNLPPRQWLSFGLSGTVAGLWWVAAITYAYSAAAFAIAWRDWWAYMNGDGTFAALRASDTNAFDAQAWTQLSMWAVGILFIVWLFKAYRSAESLGASRQRWGPGWAIGGWFIPFANLVIPKMVVNEVDRMSNPGAGEPPVGDRWVRLPRMRSSDAWWALLLVGTAAYWVGWAFYFSTPSFDSAATSTGYGLMAVGQGVLASTAALIGMVNVAIGRRLRRP